MTEEKIELVHRMDDITKKPFIKILPQQGYSDTDFENASDLIDKMLNWVPEKRISCEKALRHKFFM